MDVRGWGDGSVEYYHHLAEASRLASADRDRYLGDPLFGDPAGGFFDPRSPLFEGRTDGEG